MDADASARPDAAASQEIDQSPLARVPDDGLLVLYDGVCGLCNGLVRFLLARDRRRRLWFAPLQSELGRHLVAARGGDPERLSTLWLFERPGRPGERVWRRGRAGVRALAALGGGWRVMGGLRIVPGFLLDAGYWIIARTRYRLFGKLETCPVPAPADRARFLGWPS